MGYRLPHVDARNGIAPRYSLSAVAAETSRQIHFRGSAKVFRHQASAAFGNARVSINPPDLVDLRSDTVTRPHRHVAAMAAADGL